VQAAYDLAIKNVGSQVNFKLEEYESFSEKHGKMFTNQSLASLELAEQGEFA
jgi:hypothetical protein